MGRWAKSPSEFYGFGLGSKYIFGVTSLNRLGDYSLGVKRRTRAKRHTDICRAAFAYSLCVNGEFSHVGVTAAIVILLRSETQK